MKKYSLLFLVALLCMLAACSAGETAGESSAAEQSAVCSGNVSEADSSSDEVYTEAKYNLSPVVMESSQAYAFLQFAERTGEHIKIDGLRYEITVCKVLYTQISRINKYAETLDGQKTVKIAFPVAAIEELKNYEAVLIEWEPADGASSVLIPCRTDSEGNVDWIVFTADGVVIEEEKLSHATSGVYNAILYYNKMAERLSNWDSLDNDFQKEFPKEPIHNEDSLETVIAFFRQVNHAAELFAYE